MVRVSSEVGSFDRRLLDPPCLRLPTAAQEHSLLLAGHRDEGRGEDNGVVQARAHAARPRYDPGRVDQAGD
jgi:hypothetical protein